MEIARDVYDKVVFLDKGKIIEKSHPSEFFVNPKIERVRRFLGLEAPTV
ncbi:MAG: hypothetical protein JJT87_15850 [Halomonas sp.]|nr:MULTISPECIES: hypothetical protein [unclassified Halomonas]MCC5903386.1 hypothetical protein [Halomonas sp.]